MRDRTVVRTKLITELSLALEVAARCNANGVRWGSRSPFQDKINQLLLASGREPIAGGDMSEQKKADDRYLDTPPSVLTAICEVCGENITLGHGWVHDRTGQAIDGSHMAWPKVGTQRESVRAEIAPGGCSVAFW